MVPFFRVLRDGGGVEPHPRVRDRRRQRLKTDVQSDRHSIGLRVLLDVAQRLLDDPEEKDLRLWDQPHLITGDGEAGFDARLDLIGFQIVPERRDQLHLFEMDRAAHCLQRANQRWSLSALTLPHPLVRIVLVEQLYRAWTINSNHPYHR